MEGMKDELLAKGVRLVLTSFAIIDVLAAVQQALAAVRGSAAEGVGVLSAQWVALMNEPRA